MADTVAIKNLLRKVRYFNLEHPFFLSVEGANGKGKPEVLTLRPREIKRGLPPQVLECAEIRSALRSSGRKSASLRVL